MSGVHVAVTAEVGALRLDVLADIPPQGITALFGPSGAGKTTLLRAIAGLEPALCPTVTFGQESWSDADSGQVLAPHQRGLGYVTQEPVLFEHLTVAGNLAYAKRRVRADVGEAVDERALIDVLGLGDLLRRRPQLLSGGERQRVALARVLLSAPRLLLLDEPLTAIDLARKQQILGYLEGFSKQRQVPIIYVSHAPEEVARIAQHLLLLRSGKITASGPTAQMLEQLEPDGSSGQFDAGAVLQGRVVGVDQTFALTQIQFASEILLLPGVDHRVGEEIRLYVRARDVAIALQLPKDLSIRNCLPATVIDIKAESTGPYAQLLLDVGGEHLRAQVTRAAVHDLGLQPGGNVFALLKSVVAASTYLGVS